MFVNVITVPNYASLSSNRNYLSSQDVVDYILEKLKDPEKRKKPSLICEEVLTKLH